MSQEDQDAAIVKLVKRRAEVKRTIAFLQSEFASAGSALMALGEVCRNKGNFAPGGWTEKALPLLSQKFQDQIRESMTLTDEIAEIDASAKKMGID